MVSSRSISRLFFLYLGGFVFLSLGSLNYTPLVNTKFGPVRGLFSEPDPETGRRAEVFLGLPYALPPVGPLRFEKPQIFNSTWIYEREATQFGAGCLPLINLFNTPVSEDCLTLNIIRPARTVLHGGGFAFGASLLYSYQNLSNNFASRGAIVVTLNYRLGFYGFGSTGDAEMPGNLGLWDQAVAFRWIYENIGDFGGDNRRITAWGLSAGAGSVGHLNLSPHSQRFFQQSIEMSGPATAEWAVSDETVDYTSQFAVHLGCPFDDSRRMKECFLSKTPDEILQATTTFTQPTPKLLQFTPRIDGDFLPLPLGELIRKAPPIATLSGVTQSETHYFTILNKDMPINSVAVPPSQFKTYGRPELERYIHHFCTHMSAVFGDQKYRICEEVLDFYTRGEWEAVDSSLFYLQRLNDLTSDFFFNVPAVLFARARTAHGHQSFLYLNSYFNPAQFDPEVPLQAATHANSYPYWNGLFPIGPFEFDENDRKFQRLLADTLVRFAAEGQPAADWKPIEKEAFTHGHVDENADLLKRDGAPFQEAVDFWRRMDALSERGIFNLPHEANQKTEL
ncbi:Carboxylic ester hydrolase [Aphelenchoides fujianensis]|nr:Carboxylic ester hydrolase [Aphelenchoides fujianensis]